MLACRGKTSRSIFLFLFYVYLVTNETRYKENYGKQMQKLHLHAADNFPCVQEYFRLFHINVG